jgi:ribonuclease HII
MKPYYDATPNIIEIGSDEVGRGPLFGRVYAAAVILPKDDSFQHNLMKDSKKFHSKAKIRQASDYIKENALAWSIQFQDETVVDSINILKASQLCMQLSINEARQRYMQIIGGGNGTEFLVLVDGNYFSPITSYNPDTDMFEDTRHECVIGGDNIYTSIAAASILAKVARDEYIEELCDVHPELDEKYAIRSNKGYGAKKHIDGIKQFGITPWHRKTFGICKTFVI